MKIDETYLVTINGARQKIRLLGESRANPVILFVHGGPGFPNRHKIRKTLSSLTSRYTLACYDERGTGGSYSVSLFPYRLRIDDLIDDVIGWANWLRKKFRKEKIYVVAESFGSYLATLAVKKAPELFAAYIGYGQIYDFQDELSCQYEMACAKAAETSDEDSSEFLYGLGAPSSWEKEEWQEKVTQFYRLYYPLIEPRGYPSYEEREIIPFMKSKEYSEKDKLGWQKGHPRYDAWFRQLVCGGEYPSLKESDGIIDIPYYVFAGKYDYVAPYVLSEKWFETVQAPKKEFITFDYSAHLPAFEEPAWFKHELRRLFK